jgi:hypothetical protein
MMGVIVGALVVTAGAGMFWQRSHRAQVVGPTPAVVTVPNDSITPAPPGQRADTGTAPPTDTSARAITGTPRVPAGGTGKTPERPSGSDSGTGLTAGTRAQLDRVKAALADPDAVSAAGNGEAILGDIRRLMPRLVSPGDSVEATYYAVETNLMLDRPAEACRLLKRVQPSSRGTLFEARIERFLGDADLGCTNRR